MSDATPSREINLGTAFTWARHAHRANAFPLAGIASVVGVIYVIQMYGSGAIESVLLRSMSGCQDLLSESCQASLNASFAPLLYALTLTLIFGVLAAIAQYGLYTAALGLSRGITPTLSMMLPAEGFGRYARFMAVYAVAVTLGWGLCLLPALIFLFLFLLAPFFVLDRGSSPREAYAKSGQAAKRNTAALIALVGLQAALFLLLSLFGPMLFGLVGAVILVFVLPFILLVTAHAYRQLNAEQVA